MKPSDLSLPLSLAIAPTGSLTLYSDPDNQELVSAPIAERIQDLFAEGAAIGLLRLGVAYFSEPLPPTLAFWQQFARLFIAEVCKLSGLETLSMGALSQMSFPLNECDTFIERAPFMRGAEYINAERMNTLWQGLAEALSKEVSHFDGQLQDYLAAYNSEWNKVGRVCFHLAENKADFDHPFAFLATYTTRLSSTASVQHLPLERALKDYAGDSKRTHLLSLLMPVQKAAERSSFIKSLVDTGSLFRPLAWQAKEAYQFLKAVPLIEAAGVMVRVPNWWNLKKPPRPQVKIAVGNVNANAVGLDALLDFKMDFALPNGERLTLQELETLLNDNNHLIQIKGQWVEVDSDKLNHVLSHWKKVEHQVKSEGLSFAEGLRLLAGGSLPQATETSSEEVAEWSKVIEGPWLNEVLTRLRHPAQALERDLQLILQNRLHTTLRPYQQSGVQWLWWLYNLRLGGCLADDMGLGKTIQILALFLLTKHHKPAEKKQPHLLIVPASLLGNWQAEISKFAPDLKIWVAHSSAMREKNIPLKDLPPLAHVDLVMTTYAYVHRLAWLTQVPWNIVILDEAQCIKNPTAKQTQAIKKLPSHVRFILTGTPIENRLLDLWSLFDFVAPGLLGSRSAFSTFGKKTLQRFQESDGEGRFYAAIRHLVGPYILRRLKSDKAIIADLPDKTEVDAYCSLTKLQVALYQHAVNELAQRLEHEGEGIQRRGLVLSYLMRFKQICNHPSQWQGHGQYEEKESGKFMRLKEICEAIAAKQEKVLVFTQFREIIPALSAFLKEIFGREGLALHGQTPIKDRATLVSSFQQEDGPPFFILSLKAGGAGLNLTHASHVIHFDRWWNPAVENQATDRAYRIGQKRNVLVHKFICQGTIEEKINAIISSKKNLADELLAKGGETMLTELNNAELLELLTLDIHRALGET